MNEFELLHYRKGFRYIVGCDEVGRGSLAGPVVSGAVILNPKYIKKFYNAPAWYREIRDSKLLKPKDRQRLAEHIKEHALAWAVGEVSAETIDELNIHHASLLAMKDAVTAILPFKDSHATEKKIFVAVDGKFKIPEIELAQAPVVHGDREVVSIAAASILAKVHRDDLMVKLHKQFPQYNFAQHKGYATVEHRLAIKEFGLSKMHRVTFCDHLELGKTK
jgi:ribonuclease HII